MSEMVKRVARAIEEAKRQYWVETDKEDYGQDAPEEYLARAAIAAMRSPTEGVALAAIPDPAVQPILYAYWNAMIDKALEEGTA